MELHIQKDISISLHQQLVTQVSMQIAAGLIAPGAKLPSIRGLANRLDIHHNTCLSAYRELEEIGLIEIRHGSGARVAMQEAHTPHSIRLPEAMPLDTLAEFFIRETTHRGHTWEEALQALEDARQKQGKNTQRQLVFVDLHADILPVFRAELQKALQCPVKAVTLDALPDSLNARTEADSHFIVSRYHVQTLRDQLKAAGHSEAELTERVTLIDVGSGQEGLSLIRQLPAGSLVAIFSVSSIILRQAEAVIKALRGDEIYIRAIVCQAPEGNAPANLFASENQAEVERVLKRARIIFADQLCLLPLEALTRKPLHLIRAIPEAEMDKLRPLLGYNV